MLSIIHLSTIWEHTLTEILNHDNKTEVEIIMRAWVKHNKLEHMSDLLIYDLNDFTPTGIFCHYKETAEAQETKIMLNTPLKKLYNLYWYIQPNISFSNLNLIMMMKNLIILLMRIIGYSKKEENT